MPNVYYTNTDEAIIKFLKRRKWLTAEELADLFYADREKPVHASTIMRNALKALPDKIIAKQEKFRLTKSRVPRKRLPEGQVGKTPSRYSLARIKNADSVS